MRRTLATAATVVAAALVTSGCSAITDQLDASDGTATSASDPVGAASEAGSPILVTRDWGVVDGLLSVVVQNTSDRTLRYAEGVIVATTDDDEQVSSSIDSATACCEIVDLSPGQQFGFYLDVGPAASEIDRVDVTYRKVSWAPAGDTSDAAPAVRGVPTGLEQADYGTVVLADLRTGQPQDEVIAQALVTDGAGDLQAVVSGRWTCLQPGGRSIRMQLFHSLPAGARVDRILVHPVTEDPTRPAPQCAQAGRTR
ncbi:MAG: hypothetical protein WBP61_10825 [Nocardioides sp.]